MMERPFHLSGKSNAEIERKGFQNIGRVKSFKTLKPSMTQKHKGNKVMSNTSLQILADYGTRILNFQNSYNKTLAYLLFLTFVI